MFTIYLYLIEQFITNCIRFYFVFSLVSRPSYLSCGKYHILGKNKTSVFKSCYVNKMNCLYFLDIGSESLAAFLIEVILLERGSAHCSYHHNPSQDYFGI